MATTKNNPMLHEAHRNKIRVTQLLNRLQDNALGIKGKDGLKKVVLTPVEQRSAEILLRKAMPDLSSVALGQDPNAKPVEIHFKWIGE